MPLHGWMDTGEASIGLNSHCQLCCERGETIETAVISSPSNLARFARGTKSPYMDLRNELN